MLAPFKRFVKSGLGCINMMWKKKVCLYCRRKLCESSLFCNISSLTLSRKTFKSKGSGPEFLPVCLQHWAFPLKNTSIHLQRRMDFHFLFYSRNDGALLVLQPTVTHGYREVLCRLHTPRGTLKPHPASLTLTKSPNGHWEQTRLCEI